MLDKKLTESGAIEWYHTTWLTSGVYDIYAFDFKHGDHFLYPLDTWL